MTGNDISTTIEEIRRLAEEAGREIMRYYRSGNWSVIAKDDESPLTQADLAANQIIVPGLERLSRDPVVSEESDPTSVTVGRRFWLVDPLDGTRDFVNKLDTFVVCIALVEDETPVLGLIHAPVTGETWWAAKGVGAFKAATPAGEVGHQEYLRVLNREERPVLIAAGSRSMPTERMQLFYDHVQIKEVRRYGSALKFCRLAEGDVDLYPRFGQMNEWDTAAGQIIAEEAGCRVIDLSTGEPLKYGKPLFLNAHGFMAARGDLDLVGPIRASGLLKR